MARLVLPILISASLTACGPRLTRPEPAAAVPALPMLTAQQRASCPSLQLLKDKSIATLGNEDAVTAVQYQRCREKHWAVVNVYDQLVKIVQELKVKLERGMTDDRSK